MRKEYQEKKFADAKFRADQDPALHVPRDGGPVSVMTMLMSGLTLAIYWIGATLIDALPTGAERAALFGQMAAFSGYAMQVVAAFMMLAIIFIILPRAMVSVPPHPRSARNGADHRGRDADCIARRIARRHGEFRHVSFRYPDASNDVLHDISFKAEKGQTVALIGSTGSGKSTVVNLIPRFYDATEGEVLVDGSQRQGIRAVRPA